MNEEDRTLETVVKMLSTCIEQRDTLKRDRDEARAEWLPLSKEIEALRNDLDEAEARGYERGVREAANEVRPKGSRPCDCKRCDCGNMGDLVELTQYETMQYASVAILALLEPKKEGDA
jgi:hypothetical protein